MEKIELKTDYGFVNNKDLDKHKDSVLLINSMLGTVTFRTWKL
jgi:hypothetical protein